MRFAGQLQQAMDLARGVAETAMIRDLGEKYGHRFNYPELATAAKRQLQEEGRPLTARNFREAADFQAMAGASQYQEMLGILPDVVDVKALMEGRITDYFKSVETARLLKAERAAEEAAATAAWETQVAAGGGRAATPIVDPYADTPF